MVNQIVLQNKQNRYHGFDVSTQKGRAKYMRYLDREERHLDYKRGTSEGREQASIDSAILTPEIESESRYFVLTSSLLLLSMVVVAAIIIFVAVHFVR
jgi:hypothetical protein